MRGVTLSILLALLLAPKARSAPDLLVTSRPTAFDIPSSRSSPNHVHARHDRTIGHRMLDLENEVDPVPSSKYEVFDSILEDAKQKVTFDPEIRGT